MAGLRGRVLRHDFRVVYPPLEGIGFELAAELLACLPAEGVGSLKSKAVE